MATPVALLLLVSSLCAQPTDDLSKACRDCDLTTVRALVAQGADVNAVDKEGWTPLHWAARSLPGIRAKKVRRATPEQMKEYHRLADAAVEIMGLLLKAGADPNGPKDGEPPLVFAFERRNLRFAEVLMRGGATLDRKLGERTLAQAAFIEAVGDDDLALVDFLLSHGAKPDRDALWRAVDKGRGVFAVRFLRAGADFSGVFGYKKMPLLHYAAELGNALLVDALLLAGADPNAQTRDGETALDRAVIRSKNTRPRALVGVPDWANSSSLADFERGSRNFVATAQTLVAGGAQTPNAIEVAPGFMEFLHTCSTHLTNQDWDEFAKLLTPLEGDHDPGDFFRHERFERIGLPLFAEIKTTFDTILATRALWTRGVSPRGVPEAKFEKDRATIKLSGRMRFVRKDGVWKIPVPPAAGYYERRGEQKDISARNLSRVFHILYSAGYHKQAIVRGRELLGKEGLDDWDRFLYLWALGNAQVSSGDYASAEKTLREVEKIAPERFRWMPYESRVALACLRGDVAGAKALVVKLRESLLPAIAKFDDDDDRHRRNTMWARFTQTYSNVGAALTLAGEHDAARAALEEARKAVERAEGAASPVAHFVSMQLANLYGLTGQTESAVSAYTDLWKRIEATTGTNTMVAVQVQTNLAALHQMRGDADAALAAADLSVKIGRAVYGPQHPDYGTLLVARGGILQLRGDLDAAAASFAAARDVLDGSGSLAQAELGLATCAIAAGKLDAAVPHLDRAGQLITETFGARHRNMSNVHATRAALARSRNDLEGARAELLAAVGIVEAERGQFRNDFDRRRYLGMVQGLYAALGAVCLEAGLDEEVFEVVERHKAKSLMELLAARSFTPKRNAEAVAQLEELNRRTRPQRGLARLDERGGGALDETVDTSRHELLQKLRKLNPELAGLVTVTWPGVKDVQAVLDDKTRLVEYHALGTDLVVAFVIGPKSFRTVRLKSLDAAAEAFVREAADRESPIEDVHRTGRELYALAFQPLETDLAGVDTLVVVPHGKLHYVPLDAVHDGKAYLADRFRIVRVPSAGIYRRLRQRPAGTASGFLALADPASYLKRLPGAGEEVALIKEHFRQTTVFAGEQATEATLKGLARAPAVFHYAGHGVFDARAPELSHLALAPAGGDDGRLEVHEIHGLDFSGTRLVVLSACQGALGELGGGDEIVGLVRPFLATGASSVVASLWNVDDRATARWMAAFYEALAIRGTKPIDAIRKGQAAVRRSSLYRHPYFWAAFQMYGLAGPRDTAVKATPVKGR